MIKMYKQVIKSKRGSCLRKNSNIELILDIEATQFGQILLINQDHLHRKKDHQELSFVRLRQED